MSQRVLRDRQASQISLSQLAITKTTKRKNVKSKENPSKRAKKEIVTQSQAAVQEVAAQEISFESMLSPRRTARKAIQPSDEIKAAEEVALGSPRRKARKAQAQLTPLPVQAASIPSNSLFSPRRTARHAVQPPRKLSFTLIFIIESTEDLDSQPILSPRTKRAATDHTSQRATNKASSAQEAANVSTAVIESPAKAESTLPQQTSAKETPATQIDPLAYPNDPLLVDFALRNYHKKQLYTLPTIPPPCLSSLNLIQLPHLTAQIHAAALKSHQRINEEYVSAVSSRQNANQARLDAGKLPIPRTSQLSAWFNKAQFILQPSTFAHKLAKLTAPEFKVGTNKVEDEITATQQVVPCQTECEKMKGKRGGAQIVVMSGVPAGDGVDAHALEGFLPPAYSYLNLAMPLHPYVTAPNRSKENEVIGRWAYKLSDGVLQPHGRFLVSLEGSTVKCQVRHRNEVIGTPSTLLFESPVEMMKVVEGRYDGCYREIMVGNDAAFVTSETYVFWFFSEKHVEKFTGILGQRW